MLSHSTVHALAHFMIDVDEKILPIAADVPGFLLLIQDRPYGGCSEGMREAHVLGYPLRPGGAGDISLPGALQDLAGQPRHDDHEHTPLRPDQLDEIRHRLRRRLRLLAWGVFVDGPAIVDDQPVMLRRLDAVDADGRIYRLHRVLDDGETTVIVDEPSSPIELAPVHGGLALLHLAARTQTDRT